jgi:transcriptional regulator with XRE-family HTH domain
MPKKSANQILAENLQSLMTEQKYSALALSKRAGIAPNTIGNYLDTSHQVTSKGRERSAKLAEVERLAEALGVTLIDLLTDGAKPAHVRTLSPQIEQMLDDLDDLPAPKQSRIIDMIHNDAEDARAAAAHLVAKKRVPVSQPAKTTGSASGTIKIKFGDGNPGQGLLDLKMVDDPFNSEPSQRESEWYSTLEGARHKNKI